MTPDPVTVSPSGPDETAPPIRVSTSRIASAGCSESDGQSLIVTEPPVTSAAARNGPALDRSGSTAKSPRSSRPGRTRQKSGRSPVPTSTSAPAPAIIRTVISMCGSDGTGGPSWCTSMPRSNRAAASSSPETSWDEAEASSVTAPPRTAPEPWMVNGSAPRPPSSIDTPSSRRAASRAADRPFPGPGIAVERHRGGRERGQRGQEPHGRTRVAHVDADRRAGVNGAARDGEVRPILFERATEDPQRGDGEGCVAGLQHPPQHRWRVAERGQQQRPVGDRLGARQPQGRAHRSLRDRCAPAS